MKWPPTNCWTSPITLNGHRHFIVKRYWGKKEKRYVELFATRDKKFLVIMKWKDLSTNWYGSWLRLVKED